MSWSSILWYWSISLDVKASLWERIKVMYFTGDRYRTSFCSLFKSHRPVHGRTTFQDNNSLRLPRLVSHSNIDKAMSYLLNKWTVFRRWIHEEPPQNKKTNSSESREKDRSVALLFPWVGVHGGWNDDAALSADWVPIDEGSGFFMKLLKSEAYPKAICS